MLGRLDQFRSDITSQFGENGLLAYLINAYPQIPRVCLEVGAGNGVTNSNTNPLWVSGDWRVLLIDVATAALRQRFAHLPNVTIVTTAITPQGEQSLDAIADAISFPRDIGIASIDIDSCDYWVLSYLEYLRPAVIVIEFNARIPAHVDYHDLEDQPFLRHSALAIERLARMKGYRVVACTGPNAILVSEATIATNPAAVPDLPLGDLYDHTYAARFPSVIGAKFVTDLPVYATKPSMLMRGYGQARYLWFTMRDRRLGRPPKVHTITPAMRAHAERSGLWI